MRNVLLCNPDFIRLNSNISDNVNSKVLATAIREVQNGELQEIIGEILADKLCDLVSDGTIGNEDNKAYKNLLDKAQMYITYKVISEICVTLNVKIDNAGLIQTSDENMNYLDVNDTFTLKEFYQKKADHYCYLLQNYIMEHLNELPEVTEFQAWKIHSTLYTAASSGVFLGGARGKGWFKPFPYRYQRGINWPNR